MAEARPVPASKGTAAKAPAAKAPAAKPPARVSPAGAATARTPQIPAPGTSAWHCNERPTRVVNVDAAPATVKAMCTKEDLAVSSMERLPSGGTRVVLVTMDGADALRRAFKGKVIDGVVQRVALRQRGEYA